MNFNNVDPGNLRKYLYEYALLALVACVVYLFLSFNRLNEFIRNELVQQRTELIKTVERNGATIDKFLEYQRNK